MCAVTLANFVAYIDITVLEWNELQKTRDETKLSLQTVV